jgi:hypothetical protein
MMREVKIPENYNGVFALVGILKFNKNLWNFDATNFKKQGYKN